VDIGDDEGDATETEGLQDIATAQVHGKFELPYT
jgi:hypothetical protein